MACQQLISHVSASARYMANLSAEHQPTAVNGQMTALKTYIAKIAGPDEAMQASEAIRQHFGPYLAASRMNELVCLLNDAACKLPLVVVEGKAATAAGQYWHDTFWRDVPKDVFDNMADKAVQSTARMQGLFKYLADRGLRSPSEKTFSAMLALFSIVMDVLQASTLRPFLLQWSSSRMPGSPTSRSTGGVTQMHTLRRGTFQGLLQVSSVCV